ESQPHRDRQCALPPAAILRRQIPDKNGINNGKDHVEEPADTHGTTPEVYSPSRQRQMRETPRYAHQRPALNSVRNDSKISSRLFTRLVMTFDLATSFDSPSEPVPKASRSTLMNVPL